MNFYEVTRAIPTVLMAAEVFELTDQISTLSDPVVAAGHPYRGVLDDLGQANLTLAAALSRDKGEDPLTKLRSRYDGQRDKAFSQLTRRVALTIDDEDEQPDRIAAAQLVDSILDDHPRNLHRLVHAINTAELKVLIPKLRAPAVDVALQLLGLKQYVDRMETANDAFSDVEEQAAQQKGGRSLPTSPEAERLVRLLAGIFLANLNYSVYKGDAAITTLTQQIEAATTKVRAAALQRTSRSAKADQPAATPAQ